MIESGSTRPGIDPADFRLPAATALRVEPVAAALHPLFLGYAMLDSDAAIWRGTTSWSLPSWPRLWIPLTDGPIAVQPRSRPVTAVDTAMLIGPSSRGMPVTSHGGVSILVDIGPAGWARWFGLSAEDYRDRVTPLLQLWPAARVNDLMIRLGTLTRSADLKPMLDGLFTDHLPAPHPDEPLIEHARALVTAGEIVGSTELADALGVTPYALRRLFAQHFGFAPKVVLRRTRFMRALTALMLSDAAPDFAHAPGYHDASHFLRDAGDFLDLTPRRFLALPIPYLRAMLRARAIVLGAPTALLDAAGA
jgi:AraC-like DNA-binding protein